LTVTPRLVARSTHTHPGLFRVLSLQVWAVGVDGTHGSEAAFNATMVLSSAKDRVIVMHSYERASGPAHIHHGAKPSFGLTRPRGANAPADAVVTQYRHKMLARSCSPLHTVVMYEVGARRERRRRARERRRSPTIDDRRRAPSTDASPRPPSLSLSDPRMESWRRERFARRRRRIVLLSRTVLSRRSSRTAARAARRPSGSLGASTGSMPRARRRQSSDGLCRAAHRARHGVRPRLPLRE
jgi:hypothetical protein